MLWIHTRLVEFSQNKNFQSHEFIIGRLDYFNIYSWPVNCLIKQTKYLTLKCKPWYLIDRRFLLLIEGPTPYSVKQCQNKN